MQCLSFLCSQIIPHSVYYLTSLAYNISSFFCVVSFLCIVFHYSQVCPFFYALSIQFNWRHIASGSMDIVRVDGQYCLCERLGSWSFGESEALAILEYNL